MTVIDVTYAGEATALEPVKYNDDDPASLWLTWCLRFEAEVDGRTARVLIPRREQDPHWQDMEDAHRDGVLTAARSAVAKLSGESETP